jgi:hypothetical protein
MQIVFVISIIASQEDRNFTSILSIRAYGLILLQFKRSMTRKPAREQPEQRCIRCRIADDRPPVSLPVKWTSMFLIFSVRVKA